MTTYARIQNNVAVEIFIPPTGFTLAQCFHSEVAVLFTEVPDGTEAGATELNGAWTNPPAVVAPTPAPMVYAPLTPMQFYLAFKPAERMLIKALANGGVPVGSALVSPSPTTAIPTDPIIAEFWATYELATQVNAQIDPNLDSITEGLAYLSSPTAPTPPVILAARIAQIQAGIAQ